MMMQGVARSSLRQAVTSQTTRSMSFVAPLRDMKFQLNEVRNTEKHYEQLKHSGGEGATPDMVDAILTESARFSENELYPCNETADSVGCQHKGPNEVVTPPGFKEAYQSFVEGGWQGLSFPEEYGGQGLPQSLALFQSELTSTANWTWTMFPGLSKGGINTVIKNGSDEIKSKYLQRMIEGTWTGTMCLTEPHCGSDLAQVSTKAEPLPNGKYAISGTKIFISCGEHDMAENIVHCVLARLPDSPAGIKGISLFVVPKFKVNDDGTLTDELNGATVGRIENKMGCHGSPTCELIFENAEGELLGVRDKGMRQMFDYINVSRVGTAIQGLAAAEGSYQKALAYAKDRLAMRSLSGTKFPDKVADPIIVHPGVRQMLLTQKVIAEGGRGMVYDSALIGDLMAEAEAKGDTKTAKDHDEHLAFLTPILKGFLTEAGLEAANLGIQAFGGHGYIKSNGVEQIVRDVRIASVWEGTTQIQAIDLLGRKVLLQKLAPITSHTKMLAKLGMEQMTSPASSTHGSLRKHGFLLAKHAAEWQYLSMRIAARAASNKDAVGSASVPYLMYSGYVSLAEQWLKQEAAAAKALDAGATGTEAEFYKGKIAAAQFMFSNILPRTIPLKQQMLAPVEDVMSITPEQFAPTL